MTDVDFRELETILKMVGLDREYHMMATVEFLYLFATTARVVEVGGSSVTERFETFEALSTRVHELANEKILRRS